MKKNKIIIVGAGSFGIEIIKKVIQNFDVIVIEFKEEKIKNLNNIFKEGIEIIHGDASSILVWKKLDLMLNL